MSTWGKMTSAKMRESDVSGNIVILWISGFSASGSKGSYTSCGYIVCSYVEEVAISGT
jgi:hypothetical protein